MKNIFNNYSLVVKSIFLSFFVFLGINSSYAATFRIASPANGDNYVYNDVVTLTVSNAPGGTRRVDYYANGTYIGSSTTGTSYSFNQTASSIGTYTITAKAYSSTTYPNGTLKGTTTNTVTVTVNPTTPTLTGGGSGCNVTVSASGSLPAGGTYNWYNVSGGGSALATGSTYSPTATGTYYASYTYSGIEGARSSGTTATVTGGPVISTAPTSPSGSLYFSYPFNGNANDASGNSNNGTVQGGASLTTDRYNTTNSAYSFNGTSQYISTSTGISAPGPQNFSISVWFNASSPGGMLVGYSASKTGLATQYDRHIYMDNSGYVYFGLYNGATYTINSTSTYADGNWHHAVATCSTTSGSSLYIDGQLEASSAAMTAPETYGGNGYWRVGYNQLSGWPNAPTDLYFTGSLDDIAVYSTALTASQVYTLYGAGSSPVCANTALSLQVDSVAGATYLWTGPGGYSSSTQNPTVSASATTAMAGAYTCIVTNSGGCSSAINVTAVVNAAPTSAFTATSSVLVGANATITYSGTYSASSTYTWDFNGGTIVSGSGVGPYTVNWSGGGSKTVTLTVTNSGGCSSISTQTVTVTSYGNYAFSDPITLNTTSLGISSNLTNFPALLSIQDNNLIISGACADKVYYPNGPNYDFAFYDNSTLSELYYQVVSYNQTTGTLLVWVQIPTLTYATNKSITFYYGSASPSVTHNTAFYENTWSSDYKGVFHFDEPTYTGSVTDATTNGNTGATSGMTSADLVTGKIGTAYLFNGSSKMTFGAVTVTGPFTISAWVKLSAINQDQKIMTNQTSSGSSSGGYKLGVYSTNVPETESGTAIDRGSSPTPTALATGTWHYVQGVFTGTTLSTYVDGTQYEVKSTTNAPSSTSAFYIGVGGGGGEGSPPNYYYFNGLIDEARVSNVAKSADWLKAEYVDQNSPATFTTVGSTGTNTTDAAAISGDLTYTWTGSASTDPTAASNWNNTTAGTTGQLPAFDGSASLVIPSGLTNYPSLTADASVYGLTIASGALLNLNGHTLSVGCNIYNSSTGQILYGSSNNSGLTWNGSAATQTYNGSTTTNTAALGNMTINNSAGGTVTISGGPVDIYNTLTITKGNLVVGASPAALTLKSTAAQSASVAAIPSGYSITGTVAVERYISGGSGYRGYRLISSPVYAATVGSNNVFSINYLQAGIYLTGSSGGGFDKTGNPTIYLYREDQIPSNATFTSGNYWGVSKINNSPSYNYYLNDPPAVYNFPVGNGVMVFFRGNRALASVTAETTVTYTPVADTLLTSGTLNQGQVIVHDWYTPGSANIGYTGSGPGTNHAVRGFNLVGNPYASSIDWSTFSNTTSTAPIYGLNISPTIWTFDPTTKNFASYNALTHIATGNGGSIIASGQGFFVQATAASPSLTFQEAAKTSTQVTGSTLLMDKPSALNTLAQSAYNSYLRLKLITDSVNYNDMVIGFNSASTTKFNPLDDSKFMAGDGNSEAISGMTADSIKVSAKWLPFPKNNVNQVIKLNVAAAASGSYTLERTDLKEIPAIYEIWLMDSYKKDSLDIKNNTTYAFDVNLNETASYGKNRFAVVIRQDPALGIHLLSFTAEKVTSGSQIEWNTENEENYTDFAVERSTDGGATFNVIDGLASNAQATYSFIDTNPPAGADMYRLQITDLNGNITYSKAVTLMYGNANTLVKTGIAVYPNPAKSILNLSIATGFNQNTVMVSTPETGAAYDVRIANILGSVVKTATISEQSWQTDVSALMPGTYVIQVINKSNNEIVGQDTFIKL